MTDDFPALLASAVHDPLTLPETVVDYQLQLVLLPVTDIDRAKAFYAEKAGFHLDVDVSPTDEIRVVQLTPPGSACSIGFGRGITDADPGSAKGLHLVVTDIEAARDELAGRGLEISGVRHLEDGEWQPGPDPDHARYASFADFADPDGNVWVLQEVGHPDEKGTAGGA
jgi:catechol 2,3-dioxygenase-like lactoylglutathione lyase family enzyme